MKLLVQCPTCSRFHRTEFSDRRKTPPTSEESICWYCKRGIPIRKREEEKKG